MRISSLTLFRQFNIANQTQQSNISQLQQQISTGRRIGDPADDPIGTARSLNLTQAIGQLEQYTDNADFAEQRLQFEEAALESMSNLLQRSRELAVNSANLGAQSTDTFIAIRTEVEQIFQEMLNVANTRDAAGEYLFSGFQSRVQAFTRTATGATYNGDQGQLNLQVSATKQVAVSDSGYTVFQQIKNGNGDFSVSLNAANTGSATISPGSVTNAAAFQAQDFTIRFTAPNTYDVINNTTATTIITGAAYTDGAQISFNGLATNISGAAQTGDEFFVRASRQQDIFTTMQNFLNAVSTFPNGGTANAQTVQQLQSTLQDLDQSLSHVTNKRSEIGARLNSLSSSREQNDSVAFELTRNLSEIRDIDYAEAISNLELQLTTLEAAQRSYISIQGLSLFDFIR